MTAEIEVVNQSLAMIGSKPINSLTDDSHRAILANNMLPISRRAVLRDLPWHFARRYVRLAETGDDFYISDFPLVSRKPHDCIRAIQMYLPVESIAGFTQHARMQQPFMPRWKVVGNYIGQVEAFGDLLYTSDVPTDMFDALAVEYLSGMLAMKLAIPLRSSDEIRSPLVTHMRTMRKEAAKANGLEGLRDKFVTPGKLTISRRAQAGSVIGG